MYELGKVVPILLVVCKSDCMTIAEQARRAGTAPPVRSAAALAGAPPHAARRGAGVLPPGGGQPPGQPQPGGVPRCAPCGLMARSEGVGAPVALPASSRRSAGLRVGAAALAGVTAPINVLRFSEATRMRAGLGASPGKRIMPPFLVVAANEFRRARAAAHAPDSPTG